MLAVHPKFWMKHERRPWASRGQVGVILIDLGNRPYGGGFGSTGPRDA
jgi:hypothetical protein